MKFALSSPSHKPDISSALFKNFRESYVSHCSVIKVPVSQTARVLYHIFQILSSTFFNFFEEVFQVLFPAPSAIRLSGIPGVFWCFVTCVPQTACLLYHIFHFLSTTFLSFLNCLNCIFKMYSCDSSVRIPQFPVAVNCFFSFFYISKKPGLY